MPAIILLDTGPLSNCVVPISDQPGASPSPSESCRRWLIACERQGATILVPAVAYYECLREIERRQATEQKRRLRHYCFQVGRFLPLTTEHLERAATLWAQARLQGAPTASDESLDADVLLCAQVQSLELATTDYVVATTNTKHLTSFVHADLWQNVAP